MKTSMVMADENGGKQSVVNGGGGGGGSRRKPKANELTHKKKQPQRGMGVAQLERLRLQERWINMTQLQHASPSSSSSAPTTTLPNGAVQFRPAMVFHGPNLFSSDHPFLIGSCNLDLGVDNSKELSSIPKYVNCTSVCHKKKRIDGSKGFTNEDKNISADICSANPFDNFWGNNNVVEKIDAADRCFAVKTRPSLGQGTDVMAVRGGDGGGALTEYEFFPEKGGGEAGCSSSSWEFKRIGGLMELRCGDGCCVTAAATGSEQGGVREEGSCSTNNISVDLCLRLSY